MNSVFPLVILCMDNISVFNSIAESITEYIQGFVISVVAGFHFYRTYLITNGYQKINFIQMI